METLVQESRQKVIHSKPSRIDSAICYIDILNNVVYYANNIETKVDNALEICKELQCNKDYGYVWNDKLMFINDISKARYFVNFKLIKNIYVRYNYFNVSDYNNISSNVELLVKFEHYDFETCFLNISNDYIFSFTNTMNEILGYNPFSKNLN